MNTVPTPASATADTAPRIGRAKPAPVTKCRELGDLEDEVARLTKQLKALQRATSGSATRREVAEFRAILSERDDEQLVVENIVEYLVDRESTLTYVVAALVTGLNGDRPQHGGSQQLDMLYDGERHALGFRQGRIVLANWRPARRWRQFGTKRQLIELAAHHDVEVKRADVRASIIRKLWRRAPHALPGGGVIRG